MQLVHQGQIKNPRAGSRHLGGDRIVQFEEVTLPGSGFGPVAVTAKAAQEKGEFTDLQTVAFSGGPDEGICPGPGFR